MSVGIIGGADGPTSIFLTNGGSVEYLPWILTAFVVVSLVGYFVWKKKKG